MHCAVWGAAPRGVTLRSTHSVSQVRTQVAVATETRGGGLSALAVTETASARGPGSARWHDAFILINYS